MLYRLVAFSEDARRDRQERLDLSLQSIELIDEDVVLPFCEPPPIAKAVDARNVSMLPQQLLVHARLPFWWPPPVASLVFLHSFSQGFALRGYLPAPIPLGTIHEQVNYVRLRRSCTSIIRQGGSDGAAKEPDPT